jgi:hypothetical protein
MSQADIAVPCPALSTTADFSRDVVRIAVPRDCLAEPAWIRVLLTISWGDPDGESWEDNPHSDKPFRGRFTQRLYPG